MVMIPSELKPFQYHMDRSGLIHPTPNNQSPGNAIPSDNGTLFSTEALIGLHTQGKLTQPVKMFYSDVFKKCEQLPGLLNRNIGWNDNQEQIDNYTAVCTASVILNDGEQAKRIVEYGKSSKWLGLFPKYLYNNPTPGKWAGNAWMGRFPQLICHMHFCAGLRPSLFSRLYWHLVMLHTAFFCKKDYHDGWILSWLMAKVGWKQTWLEKITCWIWQKRFLRAWPEGLGGPTGIMGAYFVDYSHPNCIALIGETGGSI